VFFLEEKGETFVFVRELVLRLRNDEAPIRRTREGGSEWEPIKILFKNSAYEPDFTRAPLQASLAKSTQPLKCY
jgi:hypothetical protein